MTCIVTKVDDVRPHGDNLSIVRVGANEVVANRKDDGSFRWVIGEPVVYITEGSVIPPDVLRERGYFDEEKGKGLLEGNKGNRVKMRRFAGFESRGLLFKVKVEGPDNDMFVCRGDEKHHVVMGQDVADLLSVIEMVAH